MSLLREKYVVITRKDVVLTRKRCRFNEKRCRYYEKRSRYNDIIEWKKYYMDGSITSPYCYGFQFPGFLHLSITSALSRVLAQCILPSSMLHLRCDCLSPVLYQRSLPSLYLLHSPCRLCEVLPLYVCMSERFSFYSVYLLSLTHA